MKMIIILISFMGFTILGCDEDRVVTPFVPELVLTQVPSSVKTDSTKTPVWVPDFSIVAPDTFLFKFKDADSNVYHAIQIGKQIWSKENLKTTRYNDGTPVPYVQGTAQWMVSGEAYCFYNNDGSLAEQYGLLYNYKAAVSNKLAPKGWHVSTLEDWNTLMLYIGNKPFPTIGDVGALVNPRDWPSGPFCSVRLDSPFQCTNNTHFTALPNGYRDKTLSKNLPEFDCLGSQASWWAVNNPNGEIIYLDQTFGIFNRGDRPISVGSGIRLVKNVE